MRVGLLLLAACSAAPTPQPPVASSGRAERLSTSGRAERLSTSFEAYALEDGYLVAPNDGTMIDFGRPASEVADVLGGAGLSRDTIRLDLQCLLVRTGGRVLLFDTGAAQEPWAKAGHLVASLARAGVGPSDVTDIFISHAHSDHVMGLVTPTGALAFPSAAIHLSAPEWAVLEADTDDNGKRLVAAIASKVAPFPSGAQLLPEVKAVATPGHTPGHTSYEIGTGDDKLFYIGDLVHHSVISLAHPEWQPAPDADKAAAVTIRAQTLATLASNRTRVFAFHFPYPGVGFVEGRGQGFQWRAAK